MKFWLNQMYMYTAIAFYPFSCYNGDAEKSIRTDAGTSCAPKREIGACFSQRKNNVPTREGAYSLDGLEGVENRWGRKYLILELGALNAANPIRSLKPDMATGTTVRSASVSSVKELLCDRDSNKGFRNLTIGLNANRFYYELPIHTGYPYHPDNFLATSCCIFLYARVLFSHIHIYLQTLPMLFQLNRQKISQPFFPPLSNKLIEDNLDDRPKCPRGQEVELGGTIE